MNVISKEKRFLEFPIVLANFFQVLGESSEASEELFIFGDFPFKNRKNKITDTIFIYSEADKKWGIYTQMKTESTIKIVLNDLKIFRNGRDWCVFDSNSKRFFEYSQISEHVENHNVAICVANNAVYFSGGHKISEDSRDFYAKKEARKGCADDYKIRKDSGGVFEEPFFGSDAVTNELQCMFSELYSWRKLSPMQTARFGHELVACKKFLFAIGGKNFKNMVLKTVEKYDTVKDQWTTVASTNNEFVYFGSVVYNDKIFIVANKQFEVYIPEQDIWLELPGPDFGVHERMKLAVLNGTFYAIGGVTSPRMQVFEPQTRRWKESGLMDISIQYAGVAVVKRPN